MGLEKVKPSERARVKADVGEFIVEETLRYLSRGQSPVKGERFVRLTKEYADEFKGGNRTPNMELTGDMLDALKSENRIGGTIEVGIFGASQSPKADGHNKFSAESANSDLPKRRFVPEIEQEYKEEINRGIRRIISSNAQPAAERRERIIREEPELSVVERILGQSAFDRLILDLFEDE